jgi:hypothetical protein
MLALSGEPGVMAPLARSLLARLLAGQGRFGDAGLVLALASGLRGAWREAAKLWAARDEPYEQALELLAGDAAGATAEGQDLLRSLGATGTMLALHR